MAMEKKVCKRTSAWAQSRMDAQCLLGSDGQSGLPGVGLIAGWWGVELAAVIHEFMTAAGHGPAGAVFVLGAGVGGACRATTPARRFLGAVVRRSTSGRGGQGAIQSAGGAVFSRGRGLRGRGGPAGANRAREIQPEEQQNPGATALRAWARWVKVGLL